MPWSVLCCAAACPRVALTAGSAQTLDIKFSEGRTGVTDLPKGPFRRNITQLCSDGALAKAALDAGAATARARFLGG